MQYLALLSRSFWTTFVQSPSCLEVSLLRNSKSDTVILTHAALNACFWTKTAKCQSAWTKVVQHGRFGWVRYRPEVSNFSSLKNERQTTLDRKNLENDKSHGTRPYSSIRLLFEAIEQLGKKAIEYSIHAWLETKSRANRAARYSKLKFSNARYSIGAWLVLKIRQMLDCCSARLLYGVLEYGLHGTQPSNDHLNLWQECWGRNTIEGVEVGPLIRNTNEYFGCLDLDS